MALAVAKYAYEGSVNPSLPWYPPVIQPSRLGIPDLKVRDHRVVICEKIIRVGADRSLPIKNQYYFTPKSVGNLAMALTSCFQPIRFTLGHRRHPNDQSSADATFHHRYPIMVPVPMLFLETRHQSIRQNPRTRKSGRAGRL